MSSRSGAVAPSSVEGLAHLDVTGVDAVLSILDGERHGYRELYYRWEQEQWEAGAIDLAGDAAQWEALAPTVRGSLSWWITALSAGAEEATNALVAFVDAAATEEQGVFLTTQLVDEARRSVFFDRVLDTVTGEAGAGVERRLEGSVARLDPATTKVFFELLPRTAADIRASRGGRDALIEGVALYQLLVEGALGLTILRALHGFARDEDVLPGVRQGLVAVARDSARHVAFALSFLEEAARGHERHEGAIRSAVQTNVHHVLSAFDPATHDPAAYDGLPFGPESLRGEALSALSERLAAIGVDVDL